MAETTDIQRAAPPPAEETPLMPAPVRLEGEFVQSMSLEDFAQLSQQNQELRMEREPDKSILIMSPTFSFSGMVESYVLELITHWVRVNRFGRAYSSSSGFELPDGSVKSPDVAVLSKEKVKGLSIEEQKKFLPLVPDFVVEIKSHTDTWAGLQRKMEAYLANGVPLGWLIHAENETVMVYRQGRQPETVAPFKGSLSGESALPGFSFSLDELKAYIHEDFTDEDD